MENRKPITVLSMPLSETPPNQTPGNVFWIQWREVEVWNGHVVEMFGVDETILWGCEQIRASNKRHETKPIDVVESPSDSLRRLESFLSSSLFRSTWSAPILEVVPWTTDGRRRRTEDGGRKNPPSSASIVQTSSAGWSHRHLRPRRDLLTAAAAIETREVAHRKWICTVRLDRWVEGWVGEWVRIGGWAEGIAETRWSRWTLI